MVKTGDYAAQSRSYHPFKVFSVFQAVLSKDVAGKVAANVKKKVCSISDDNEILVSEFPG